MLRATTMLLTMAAFAWLGSMNAAQASHRGHGSCCCGHASAAPAHEHAAPATPAPQSAAKAPSTRRYSYEPSSASNAADAISYYYSGNRGSSNGTTPRSLNMRSKGDPSRYNF